jgi:sensor histidine kinase YesM
LFSFALFFGGGRHRSYLLFGIYALMNVIYPMLIFFLNYYNLNIKYFTLVNTSAYFIAPMAIIFLNMFFLFNYNIPRKAIHIIVILSVIPIVYFIFGGEAIALITIYSIGLLIRSLRKKEPGSLIALIGLSVYCILISLSFYNLVFYSAVGGEIFFVFCITLSISRQIKKESLLHEEARLRSSRLEAELLKKYIKPHFLMNTLLSVISWIEESPAKAIKLIQALADEFHLVNRVSDQKLITLEQELELCESHLKLMGFRRNARYNLLRDIENDQLKIPAMIFHTLIENGISHAYDAGEDGTFKLSCTIRNGTISYVLENDGSLLLQKPEKEEKNYCMEGLGFKYVKTRLQECYPDRWELSYGLQQNKWQVQITICKKNGL